MGRRRKKRSLLKAVKKGTKTGWKISKIMSKALAKFMDRRKLDRMLGQKKRY